MKKLLLLGTLLAGGLTMNAQTIWSDDFEDENLDGWQLVDADDDGHSWTAVQLLSNTQVPVNTPGMRSASWAQTPLTPNNWAFSPAIDLTGVTGTITLSWDVWAPDPNYSDERYTVYVGTEAAVDHMLASSTTFSQLVTENGAGGSDNIYTKTLDISAFAGQTIHVAFRHHDVTDMFVLMIDNVAVYQGTVSVDSYLASKFTVFPNPVNDVLNISNSIGADINSVSISDVNGRVVKQINAGVEQINVSDLNAGVYFLNINSTEGNLTKKIVKK